MADDEGFSFGDFKFATLQPQSQPLTTINGGLTSTSQDDDDDWGDFFVAPPHPQPQTQATFFNGFSSFLPQSHLINPPNNSKSKPSINFDPFSSTPTRPSSDPAPIRPDQDSNGARKPKGALPVSLFCEVVEPDSKSFDTKDNIHSNGSLDPKFPAQSGKIGVDVVANGGGFNNEVFGNFGIQNQPRIGSGLNSGALGSDLNLNGFFDPKFPAQNGNNGVDVVTNGGGFNNKGGVLGNLHIQSQQIKAEIESDLNSGGLAPDSNNLDDGDEGDDEWVFMGAFPGNGIVKQNEEQGASMLPGSKAEPEAVVRTPEKQAGQDVSISAGQKHSSNDSLPRFIDLFAAHHGAIHKSNEMDVRLNSSSTAVNTNGFVLDLFEGNEAMGNGSGISVSPTNEDDDFDDFGDFIDASQEFASQKEDQCTSHSVVEHSPSEKTQDPQTQQENSGGPLPLSLFSDGLEESSDSLTQQNEIFQKPTSVPRNGFNAQGLGLSIHDLLSDLYSEAQSTSSVDCNKSPAENGIHSPQKTEDTTTVGDDDDWDDNSWEFKDALSETGIEEQSSSASPGTVPQFLSEAMTSLQICMDLYVKLREFLCILLSHQLNVDEKSQSTHTDGDDGLVESSSYDVEEAYKLLEGYITTEEVLSKRHLNRSHCLNEVLEALQGPKCKVIESAYSLSERLQLATNDWRIAAELLRHATSVLHILSLGSAEDQSVYVSSWSKLVSVCAQELKHGALIWERALEKNVQGQILSDNQGQQYIQALGEIYKVVELLRLSTKLFKPWVLLSLSDPQQLYGLLEECVSLWPTSGLEEALQQISDNVGTGLNEAPKAFISLIKNIQNVDVLAVHEHVFIQRRSTCRLSLLPQEILSDLKVVEWNNEPYFLILANLWANLSSPDPPQLPRLHFS